MSRIAPAELPAWLGHLEEAIDILAPIASNGGSRSVRRALGLLHQAVAEELLAETQGAPDAPPPAAEAPAASSDAPPADPARRPRGGFAGRQHSDATKQKLAVARRRIIEERSGMLRPRPKETG